MKQCWVLQKGIADNTLKWSINNIHTLTLLKSVIPHTILVDVW